MELQKISLKTLSEIPIDKMKIEDLLSLLPEVSTPYSRIVLSINHVFHIENIPVFERITKCLASELFQSVPACLARCQGLNQAYSLLKKIKDETSFTFTILHNGSRRKPIYARWVGFRHDNKFYTQIENVTQEFNKYLRPLKKAVNGFEYK